MEGNQLFYKKFGNGNKTIVLFHGFGQTHEIFEPWIDLIQNSYTIYSFDLYYHGKSMRAENPLTLKNWKVDFDQFLQQNEINDFDIGAFSLGGRFALATAKMFPKSVKKMILVAPDGVYQNPWYKVAVHPATNWIFRYLMYHPDQFNSLVKLARQFSLASYSMIRFAEKELSIIENRIRVYRSWMYFKCLFLKKTQFSEIQCQIDFILGEQDSIIIPEKIQEKEQLFKYSNTHLLPLKHHQMIEGSKSLVSSLLSEDNL